MVTLVGRLSCAPVRTSTLAGRSKAVDFLHVREEDTALKLVLRRITEVGMLVELAFWMVIDVESSLVAGCLGVKLLDSSTYAERCMEKLERTST